MSRFKQLNVDLDADLMDELRAYAEALGKKIRVVVADFIKEGLSIARPAPAKRKKPSIQKTKLKPSSAGRALTKSLAPAEDVS